MREYCPIIEYRLCKEGKKVYKKLMNLCCTNYQNLTKIYLNNEDYELLLKGIPLHRKQEFSENFVFNGKIIVRQRNG